MVHKKRVLKNFVGKQVQLKQKGLWPGEFPAEVLSQQLLLTLKLKDGREVKVDYREVEVVPE